MAESGSTFGRFVEPVRDHLSLIAPVTLVAFVFLKVFRVARAQPSTTISLLSGSDKVAIAMGALLPLLYTAASAATIAGIFLLRDAVRHNPPVRPVRAVVTLTAGLAAMMLLVPYPIVIVVAVVAAIAQPVWRGLDRIGVSGSAGPPAVWLTVAAIFGAVAVSAVAWLAVDDRPWVAAEELTVDGDVIVGYPVAETDWTTILREDTRTIVRVRSDTISRRVVCDRVQLNRLRTVAQIVTIDAHPTPYGRCGS